jgi:glucosamine-phosphate N-acetyltransferase
MDLVIRDLKETDLTQGLQETLSNLANVQLTPQQAMEIHRERQRSGVRTYVAIDPEKKEIVGTLSLLVERKFIHAGGRVGHIEDVAVRRGFEKRGIGGALVRHATEEARKLGCYKVILNCFERLEPFYASLGFRRHDTGMRIDLA